MMKTITFDCYGTLLNTDPILEIVEEIGRKGGLPAGRASSIYELNEARLMYAEPFLPLSQVIKETLERCDSQLAMSYMKNSYDQLLHTYNNFSPYPEVVSTLKALKEKGFRLIILSNSEHAIMTNNLKALDGVIDDVLLAEDVQTYKPSPIIFNEAICRFGLKDDFHIHVAQGYFDDIVPTKRLGMGQVWVNRHNEKASDKWKPQYEIHQLNELLSLVYF